MQDISKETISKAAGGDIKSFEELFRAYSDYVYNIVLKIVRYREDAQEVSQEVFMSVYRNLISFRFNSSLKTWVYRIAVNAAINHAKREGKKRSMTVEFDDSINSEGGINNVSEMIDSQHARILVNKLLGTLTPEQRACVVLRNIEGMTYEEIAQVLRVDINVVRSRLKRARDKLIRSGKEVVSYEL